MLFAGLWLGETRYKPIYHSDLHTFTFHYATYPLYTGLIQPQEHYWGQALMLDDKAWLAVSVPVHP